LHLQCFAVEAVSRTNWAGNPNICQKVHFQLGGAVALAGLAATAGYVKTKSTRVKAPPLALGKLRKELTNVVKYLDIRRGIRPGRPANGRLIDGDQFVQVLQP